jgi:hypothetical protein
MPRALALLAAAAGCADDQGSGPGENPGPVVTALSPAIVPSGGPDFTLTVVGINFVPGSTIRWDGEGRTTLFVSATELTTDVSGEEISTVRVVDVSVLNPPPESAVSPPVPFTIGNPGPGIWAVSPNTVEVGRPDFTLTVRGYAFVPASVVRWNGVDRPTTFVSGSELLAQISTSDVAEAGDHLVTVRTPGPGGGTSDDWTVNVVNAVPIVTALEPAYGPEDGSAFTLTLHGDGFVPSSVVRWNGADRPTTFVNATRLTVEVPASDLGLAATVGVTVWTPTPGGGLSQPQPFTVGITSLESLALVTNDIIYDGTRQRIYASAPSSAGEYANSVVIIDPAAGTIESSILVGSEPGVLALSDEGHYLYVSLDGANAIRRVALTTMEAEIQFEVRAATWTAAFRAEDMAVLPGSPNSIAVSAMNVRSSPRHLGVIVFDDGVPRDLVSQGHTGSNRIEFSPLADTLYGYNNETTEFGFRKLHVTAEGIQEVSVKGNLLYGFGTDMTFAAGRMYATNGTVINPAEGTVLGTLSASGAVHPDPANDRAFVMSQGSTTVEAISTITFARIAAITLPDVDGITRSLIRWGTDGLAYRASEGVVLVRTSIVTP